VEESVAFLRLCVLCQLIGAKEKGFIDEMIDKLVDYFQTGPKGSFGDVGAE
jgi:hypothetical protein